jgi:hypothetical protein
MGLMANTAVLFGDGKELSPNTVKATLDAIKAGRDIFKEGIGLAKDVNKEVQDIARNLDKWIHGHPLDPNSEAIIWEDANYGGSARGFRLHETVTNYQDIHFSGTWTGANWNDEVSSVKVSGSVIFVAWEHANFGGNRLVLMPGTSIPELRHVAGGWHDQISSSKVIEPKELSTVFT